MTSVAFDTLEFVEHLKEAGVPEKQAKAIVEAQKRAFSEVLDSSLATKADLMAVKSELQSELKLHKWMLALVILVSVIPTLKAIFG